MMGLLVLLMLAADGGVAPATKTTWQHHPDVEASRAVFIEVSAAVKAKTLTLELHDECDPEHESFTIGLDAEHRVRYLRIDRGSEDSLFAHEIFYDLQGVPRFIFIKAGAVPSAFLEKRWWLDPAGKEVWSQRKAGGDGYIGYPTSLTDAAIRDPRAWARKHARCPKK